MTKNKQKYSVRYFEFVVVQQTVQDDQIFSTDDKNSSKYSEKLSITSFTIVCLLTFVFSTHAHTFSLWLYKSSKKIFQQFLLCPMCHSSLWIALSIFINSFWQLKNPLFLYGLITIRIYNPIDYNNYPTTTKISYIDC